MDEKRSKGMNNKFPKVLAPGMLAQWRGNKQNAYHFGNGKSKTGTSQQLVAQKVQSSFNNSRNSGISSQTLIMHFGERKFEEKDFNEESSFLDILNICKKFVDIYSVGIKVTDGDGTPVKNDRDVMAMLEIHEYLSCIDLYLEEDKRVSFALRSCWLLCCGKVYSYDKEEDLQAISELKTKKEFRLPLEAIGYYVVAKYTPMSEDGKFGKPEFAISNKMVEISSPQKERKVRGENKNKKVVALKKGEKLDVIFYNNKAVGKNHKSWSRQLGKIVRDRNICPIQVLSWKDIRNEEKQHMWEIVKECFDNPNIELHCDATLEHMCTLWTNWRSLLNVNFVRPCKSRIGALKNVPSGVNAEDWKWLITNKFMTENFQGGKDSQLPDLGVIFFKTRSKNEILNGLKEKEKYEEIVRTIKSNPSLSNLEVAEKHFGQQRHGHVYGYGGGVKRKNFNDFKSTYIKELEVKLHEKDEENRNLKRRIDTFESRLNQIENAEPISIGTATNCDILQEV